MKLRFVTGNQGKLAEAQERLAPHGIDVEGVPMDLSELQADGLEDVARHKAEAARAGVDAPYIIEDAGLFIDALAGFPGVYSAYAFKTIGCDGILRLLAGRPARPARFAAVVALVEETGPVRLFRGECTGRIALQPGGEHGFGFDPIFQADGHDRTFAQLSSQEKGAISHRGRALDAVACHLASARNR